MNRYVKYTVSGNIWEAQGTPIVSHKEAMNLTVDKKSDALYLLLDDSTIVESEEVSPGVVLDYNESNEVVGVEILSLSQRSSTVDLSALEFRTN